MNWKTYEWIGFQFFSEDIRMNWKTYECIGIHTMNWGSAFFWGGRLTNELEDIRMNWGSDFFWGRRHTNELEDIRMNWKTYEWIRVQTFFFGRHSFVSKGNHSYVGLLFFFFFSVLTCLCTKALHFSHFRGGAKGRPAVPPLPPEPLLLFRGNNNNESISIHYYYFREIIIIIDFASLLLFPRDNTLSLEI